MSGYVTKELEGQLYEAEYYIEDNVIVVYTPWGEKRTQLGRMQEESLAEILLGHLIRERKAKAISKP